MIEDRQPRPGSDYAAEPPEFADGPDRAWPTAGHRPPGYDQYRADREYRDTTDTAVSRRAAHADGDRDEADDLQYGPPTERYAALADLAYEPGGTPGGPIDDSSPVPGFGPQDEMEPHPYAAESPYARRPAGAPGREPAPEPEFEPHPYAAERQYAAESPYADDREPAGYPLDREPAGYAPDDREPADPGPAGRFAAGPGASGEPGTAVHATGPGAPWGPPAQAGLDWGRSPFAAVPAAPEPGPATDVMDLSAPHDEPMPHRGDKRRRALVVAVAAAGVLVAGGVGYAVLQPASSGGTTATADTLPTTTDAPTDQPLFPDQETSPSAVPAATRASPSASPSASVSASASASPTPSRSATSRPTTGPHSLPTIVLTPKPRTSRSTTPPTTPATKPLSAAYSFDGTSSGSVTISNPNGSSVANWTVRLTVKGDNAVSASGASADRSGDTVTFRGGAVAANGTLTFSFSISGTVDTPPSGCTVNGNACS